MSDLVKDLKSTFKDKDYRHGYVDEFLNTSIATQIKVLREQRGWSQQELAAYAEMMQPRISVMENVNYSSWSIKILRKLAEAFDLTLRVSFESFGTRVSDIIQFSRENLERHSFIDDPYFKEEIKDKTNGIILDLETEKQKDRPRSSIMNDAFKVKKENKSKIVDHLGYNTPHQESDITIAARG